MPIDRRKYLDRAEVKRLRVATRDWSDEAVRHGHRQGVVAWVVVNLALLTGLRVNEIAAIRIGDFHPQRHALTVWRSKRRKPIRETLAIPNDLTRHLKAFIRWKAARGEPVTPDAQLLWSKRGPASHSCIQRIWHRACDRAGLPRDVSIHCARHTLAVHLLARTNNLRQVQLQLGHENPGTTANMYCAVPFERMREGVTGIYR